MMIFIMEKIAAQGKTMLMLTVYHLCPGPDGEGE